MKTTFITSASGYWSEKSILFCNVFWKNEFQHLMKMEWVLRDN